MNLPEFTTLPAITRFIERCQVLTIPAGAAPKDVTIQLPDSDGAKIPAHYTGFPSNLAVSDYVSVRATPQDPVKYLIMGASGASSVGDGWPFTNILTVSASDPTADYATIQDAIDAASAGDVIWLDAGTYTLTAHLVIDESITLCGDNPENTTITYDGDDDYSTILAEAADITLYGLTVVSTAVGEVDDVAAIEGDSNNLTIRNCIVTRSGSGDAISNAYAIFQHESTGLLLDNVRATCSRAASVKSCAFYGEAGEESVSAVIVGGAYDGANNDINITSGGTAELNDPILENGDIDGSGVFTGGYFTGEGCYVLLGGSSTSALPVLTLNQVDVSEEMIEFVSTIGTGNAIEAVGAKSLTTTHFIKVTIPGGLTRYFPIGTIA